VYWDSTPKSRSLIGEALLIAALRTCNLMLRIDYAGFLCPATSISDASFTLAAKLLIIGGVESNPGHAPDGLSPDRTEPSIQGELNTARSQQVSCFDL
jgi:hypothetical protein